MEMSNCDEKREFLRLDLEVPLEFKMLSEDRLSGKRDVLSRNVSASGLLFRAGTESAVPAISSIIWIRLEDKMINICSEIEEDLIQFENGIFARVVRISEGDPGVSYDVGVSFLRRKNMTEEDIRSLTEELSI